MQLSWHEAIQSHIRDFKDQLYTCTPAIVDSYNPSDCTVNVYPAITKPDKEGLYTREAYLERVPLHFQATAEIGITFPVRKGDTVLLIFGHSDAEKWLDSSNAYEDPTTRRKHNVNDAYAIAGVFKYNKSPVQSGTETDLNIRYKSSFIRIEDSGNILVDTGAGQKANFLQESGEVNVEASTKVTVKAPTVDIESTTEITMTAPKVTIDADEIDFGGPGGQGIARIGDLVDVGSGSSAGQWPIVTGSNIGKIL